MNKVNCGIATVLIGREFALTPLLNYFKNVEFPTDVDVNLYLTLGCDLDFEVILKDKIKELELDKKYNNIYFVKGVSKCYSDLYKLKSSSKTLSASNSRLILKSKSSSLSCFCYTACYFLFF